MKNIKRLVALTIVSMCLFIPSAKAYTKSDQEYIDCKANCDKNASGSTYSYDQCMSSCNAGLDSTVENNKNNHDAKVEAAKNGPKSPVNFCASTAIIWQIVGWVFLVVKILIPLLLIILGVLDFSKAVMASKDDEIKKAAKSLGMRAISAVIIFFIPTIVSIIMGIIVEFKDSGAKADYEVCKTCILNPSKCDTSKDVGKQ